MTLAEVRQLKVALEGGIIVRYLSTPAVYPRTTVTSDPKGRTLMASEKYKHINFKPPESVANAAKKGLEYREKQGEDKAGLTPSEASKEGIGSGVQRASNLKNRSNVSPEVIGQMVAFFSRHEKNKSIAPEHKDEPWKDKGHVAWLLWGGDPGKTWAEKIKAQMEAADSKKASDWDRRLERMKAGGIEVTEGRDPVAERLAAEGKIKLASTDGLRWYWDLTDQGRKASVTEGNARNGVSNPRGS